MTAWATTTLALYGVGGAAAAASLYGLRRRLELSHAKHRSLAGHSRMARRLAALMPFYEYDEARFFCADGAPAEVAQCRRQGFERLSALYKTRFAETVRRTAEAAEIISDLQFTGAYRVPFPVQPTHAHAPAVRRDDAIDRGRDPHRSRRQPLLRPDRRLRRQRVRLRLLQGRHRARHRAGSRARPGARPLPSCDPGKRETPERDFRPG